MLVSWEQIQRAQTGDSEAFGEIVRAYHRRIEGTIVRLIDPAHSVEVVDDVILNLLQSLNQIHNAAVFEPWLHRLTVNAAYAHLRRRRDNN